MTTPHDQPTPDRPLVWTRAETAAALKVSEDTVANLHRVDALKGIKIGKHLRWRPADVARFIEGL